MTNIFVNIVNRITQPGLSGHLLAWIFGALYPLAFSPFDATPIAWLSIIGYALSIDQLTPKQAAIRSWFFGFGLFATGASWVYVSMHDYGYTPAWLAIPMTIVFTSSLGIFFLMQGYVYRRFNLNKLIVLGLPATWVIFEWVRTWFLTGFPWLFLGSSQIDTPIGGYLPLVGVLGTSFIVVFCCAFWIYALQQSRLNKPLALSALVISITLMSIGLVLKNHHWVSIDNNHALNVSLIQGNISQDRKWLPEELENTKNLYLSLTESEWNLPDTSENNTSNAQGDPWHADLVIWPEAAIPQFFHEGWEYIDNVDELALTNNSTLITGIPFMETRAGQYRFYNSIFAIGHGSGLYYKQKLVPFGEYIPLESFIRGLIPFFDLPMSSFSRGEKEQPPLKVKSYRFAPFICYEIVYPEFVRRNTQQADFLLTISNDAWFGTSHGPHQHFQMTRVRALENGKYLVRGTNTGITAIVDPYGQVLQQAPQTKTTTLRGTIFKTIGNTPYSQMGSMALIDLCFILMIIVWAFARHKENQQNAL